MAVGDDRQAAVTSQKVEALLNEFAEYAPKMRHFLRERIAVDGVLVEPRLGPSWLERESEVVRSLLALREPAYAAVRQAELSYRELSRAVPGPGLWDESRELRCQVCFVAWRHALALGSSGLAGQWWIRFQQAFQAPWVGFEACEGYVRAVVDPNAGAEVLVDSYALVALSSWMRVELNRRDEAFRHLLPMWRRLISNVDIGELSPGERFAIEAEFALIEATCQRSGGKPGLAMSIVLEIEGEPQFARLPTPAKGDWEAEKIACLYELAECDAAIERARTFLQQRQECTSQARAKVALSLGVSLSLVGQNSEAAAVLGEAVAKPWIAATPLFAIAVRQALGVALLHSGNIVAGLSHLRRAGRLARSFRDCTAAALFDLFAAEALNAVGQFQESAALLKAAVSRLESTGHERWAAYGRVLHAEVLVGLGRYPEAREVLFAAIDGLRSYELQVELRGALQLLRQVERAIGQRDVGGVRRPGEPS